MKKQLLAIFSAALLMTSHASAQTLQSLQDDVKQLQRVVAVQQAILANLGSDVKTFPSISTTITNSGRNNLDGPLLSIPKAGHYLVFLNAQTYTGGCSRLDQTSVWLVSDQGQERFTSISGSAGDTRQTAGNVSLITKFSFTKPGLVKIQYYNWSATAQTPCNLTLGDINLGYMRLN